MTFAEKLRELRLAKGLSEAGLAKLSGVSFGAIHNYGLGNRQATFTSVVKIAKALGVTCEAFADCEDVIGNAPAVAQEATKEAEAGERPAGKKKVQKGTKKGKGK